MFSIKNIWPVKSHAATVVQSLVLAKVTKPGVTPKVDCLIKNWNS